MDALFPETLDFSDTPELNSMEEFDGMQPKRKILNLSEGDFNLGVLSSFITSY